MEKPAVAASLRQRLAGGGVDLVCPSCQGPLNARQDVFECVACARAYPVIAGIPDFRLLPDRFISVEDDRDKGLRVIELASARGGGFTAALDAYWSITPELAPRLAARHQAHQLMEVEIGEQVLGEIARLVAADQDDAHRAEQDRHVKFLDVGCGTVGLIAAAGSRFRLTVGVDVAFRWLLVGRLRLREAGLDPPLICANAEHLPFRAGAFDTVTANDLLEHVVEPAPVLAECLRVTAASGHCYLATNNRYSLAPEPHVHLWGVGLLARGLQASYVRSVRDHSYENLSLLSATELRRLATSAGLGCVRVEPAPLFARHLGKTVDRWVSAYNRLRLKPVLRPLAFAAPRLQTLCRPMSQQLP